MQKLELLVISFDATSGFALSVHTIVIVICIVVILLFLLFKYKYFKHQYSDFELDQAQIGLGGHKIVIRPNDLDLQIAYKIWVELGTRKIGLKIDIENDVVEEIYNSWYDFFTIVRELIKTIPVNKIRKNNSTKEIVNLSFKILNKAIRPHLTSWQARYRSWHQTAINGDEYLGLSPQELQKKYPNYNELETDMIRVNEILISYKKVLEKLIHHK